MSDEPYEPRDDDDDHSVQSRLCNDASTPHNQVTFDYVL